VSLPREFHPFVQDDVASAHRWYERQRVGLGDQFLDAVQDVLSAIDANPARFGFADGDVREAQLNRFPYAVYYRVLADRVRVLAVYHTARNPAGWQRRL